MATRVKSLWAESTTSKQNGCCRNLIRKSAHNEQVWEKIAFSLLTRFVIALHKVYTSVATVLLDLLEIYSNLKYNRGA